MIRADTPIRELMSTDVHVVDLETSLPEARRLLEQHGVRHLPVVDGGKVVGLLSERDLGKLEGFPMVNLNLVAVPDAMMADPYVVGPEAPVLEVLQTLLARRIGSAVVAKDGRAIGMFTTMDAVRLMVETLG